MKKVTQKQAEFVLKEVAKWLGDQGMMTVDKSPVPTGSDAAYKGIGPELQMNFSGYWSSSQYPAVVLESGYAPHDWAVSCSMAIQQAADAKEMNIFVEPATGWALGIFRED